MRKLGVAAFALAAGVLMSACGGGGGADTSSGQDGLGAPADAASATRTVEIRAGNDLRFQPDNVQVKVGDTVTFHVVNVATVEHDFTLGDESEQAQHEKEMKSMSSGGDMHVMGDSANAIHIPAGQSKDLTWKFTKAGTTLFGCHEPGHYDSGMKGTITVT